MILSTAKKASELSFCSRLKIYVLMVSTLAFVFKIIRPIIFSAVKKGSFPQLRKFSTAKDFFNNRRNFLQSRKFSANKDQKGSPKSRI